MNRKAKSDHESLCEKSMKIVTNIVKLSSFSIAHMTLGTTTGKDAKHLAPTVAGSDMASNESMLSQFPESRSRRSQEPQSHSNPIYVTKPVQANGSLHLIHKERADHIKPKREDSVDGLASDYIRKVRKQLGYDFHDTSKLSPYALPSLRVVK
ncbi:Homeobox-leucine zipper protein [Quillaja saponaria]|uniref:Homeobox-leucine zipper protein n=1 Tax=Quillaja saponaria TaxID=32244 RepID=A0AAD7PHY8_QUISA|nr:Homeobox-leucine zipper protein [Quillaja saponaria]